MPITHDERLIYGFDPLCGWCFAFRPTMHAIREAHPDVPIDVSSQLIGGSGVNHATSTVPPASSPAAAVRPSTIRRAGVPEHVR